MKGIQNKTFISQELIAIHVSRLCHRKGKLKGFSYSQLTCMHHVVSFGELSNNANTTETGSMCVVARTVAISYDYPALF
jgi:hypothetical protein